jgi:dienelactone hydrolase
MSERSERVIGTARDPAVLQGWERGSFDADGRTHETLRRGEGPGVIVIHELPGITPLVARFAREVVDRGFTVVMPSLTGTPGRPMSFGYVLSGFAKVCVSREFTTWAVGRTSPVISWLRALARSLHDDVGGPGVGVVGMCLTGGFALGMMVDPIVVAPVLSQPSLPFAIGRSRGADLNISEDDRASVAARAAAGCDVLGLRYVGDKAVGTRFDTLADLLGDRFIAVEISSRKPRDHSVLTEQRDDASVEQVLDFLVDKLRPGD